MLQAQFPEVLTLFTFVHDLLRCGGVVLLRQAMQALLLVVQQQLLLELLVVVQLLRRLLRLRLLRLPLLLLVLPLRSAVCQPGEGLYLSFALQISQRIAPVSGDKVEA